MKQRGFTIIELMITIVIGGILIAGGVAAYRGLGDRQSVKQAGLSFQTDLKSYQQKALSGQKPAVCGGSDRLTGYQVSYVDEQTYSVEAICELTDVEPTEVSLPDPVTFSAAFAPAQIFFPVLHSSVTGAQSITLEASVYSYQVTIEPSGAIHGQSL